FRVQALGGCDTYQSTEECESALVALATSEAGKHTCGTELAALAACGADGQNTATCVAQEFAPEERAFPTMLLPYRVDGCEGKMNDFLTCAFGPSPNPPVLCSRPVATPEGYANQFEA